LCSFTSTTNLKITFGSSATVEPDDEITLKDYALQTSSSSASLFTMNETFVVDQPLVPTIPVVSLVASSEFIGVCDDLILNGAGTTGSGGRAMIYNYSVMPGNDMTKVANVSEILEIANSHKNGIGKFRVDIPSDAMQKNGEMVFKLIATNFLGYSGVATVYVKKLHIPAPRISIQGANPYLTTRSSKLKLKASAEMPIMTCVDSSVANAKMSFIWYEDTGGFTGSLTDTSKNPRFLNLAADSLEASTSYQFRVVGFMTDTPNVNNSATVEVQVSQQDVVAQISGGSYQQFGRDTSFDLDASDSYDPDDSAGSFSYFWSCNATSSTADCSGLTIPTDNSTLPVPDLTLTIGKYTFTLLVVKGSRNDTAEVDIEIVAGAPPVISITALTQDKYNTDSDGGFLSLESSVTSTLTYTAVWSADGSDVSSLFVSGKGYASTVTGIDAIVGLSLLTMGETYTLVLTATDSEGESSYSTISVEINEPPESGEVSVTPGSGYALETFFHFTAEYWVDDDLPFTYIFGTTGVNEDGSLDEDSLSPFGGERDDAFYEDVTLSTGLNSTNYTVGCYVEVVDSYGAVGSATTSVRVRSRPLSVGELLNISETKASEAIESSDADAAKQILSATTEGMGSTTDETRRRTLLGSESSAEALRASVLANLWATYEITPITVSDVASLLSVLVGVVDTPSEVTYDVASGSHYFLQTVLRVTLGADIGISTSSTDDIGNALTYIFETSWFDESSTESFVNAQNVSNVLSLTSAAQMYGAYDGVGYDLNIGDIDMYSYRTAASSLLEDASVELSLGGSSDTITSAYFNTDVSELITASGESSLVSSDLLDLRIHTLSSNIYDAALEGTYGSPAAVASRLDQKGSAMNGKTLLRSKLTGVQLSLQDSTEPMEIRSLPAGAFQVTLAATVAFNTSFNAFKRTFSCSVDGSVLDMNCPLTSETHTCDFAAHGDDGTYFFEYTCPYVEPTCLYWDETTLDFEGDDCTLVSGYSTDAVTCECTRTGIFILGANSTQPLHAFYTTDAPTQVPTPIPSPEPTHIPTPEPSAAPTPLPTAEPTHVPTPLPTYLPSNPPSGVPTYLPTSDPTAQPTMQPTMQPTYEPTPRPSTNPSIVPVPAPSHSPSVLPTLVPPTSFPTHMPSAIPTKSDTVAISVELICTASAASTQSDVTNIASAVESTVNIANAVVKNTQITSVSSRRLSDKQSQKHRRLATYTWTVLCDVEASLSEIGESSVSSFEATVGVNLNSGTTLSDAILASVSSVTSLDDISTSFTTRHAPSPSPTEATKSGGSGSSSASANIIIISMSCLGAILIGLFIYFRTRPKITDENEDVKFGDPENEIENGNQMESIEMGNRTTNVNLPTVTSLQANRADIISLDRLEITDEDSTQLHELRLSRNSRGSNESECSSPGINRNRELSAFDPAIHSYKPGVRIEQL